MSYPSVHPSDWTLESFAEGALPPEEQTDVAQHVQTCSRCAAETESYRAMFAALAHLPRFEPTAHFSDAVMARVAIPQPAQVLAWARRWLPSTGRGWGILTVALLAPAMSVVALVAWLLSQSTISPLLLAQWSGAWLRDTAWGSLVRAGAWMLESRAWQWGQNLIETASGVSTEVLSVFVLFVALAIPLSAWSLVHLLRTPSGGAAHA